MYRKNLVYLFLAVLISISLCGCQKQEAANTQPIKIAALNGPTGMGMVKLMNDESDKYEITLYQSPDEITGKIVSGDIDIACVPSNLAAVLYTKTEKNISLLATNTLGTLYIVENGSTIQSLEDLKGKTIVASGQGSTPEYVLDQLLTGAGIDPEKDVNIKFLANHTDVVTELVANEGTIALLPQPHVTIAVTKNPNVHIALDLNESWKSQEQAELPMGVIIGNKKYVEDNKSVVDSFLSEYEESVKFVNDNIDEASKMIAEKEILPSDKIAQNAIPYCHIVYISAADCKEDLTKFYSVLQGVNPKSIGGSLPDDEFYYSK